MRIPILERNNVVQGRDVQPATWDRRVIGWTCPFCERPLGQPTIGAGHEHAPSRRHAGRGRCFAKIVALEDYRADDPAHQHLRHIFE